MKYDEPKVGDVVIANGMRGIVREVRRNDEIRVAAGRTDPGIWLQANIAEVIYRADD